MNHKWIKRKALNTMLFDEWERRPNMSALDIATEYQLSRKFRETRFAPIKAAIMKELKKKELLRDSVIVYRLTLPPR